MGLTAAQRQKRARDKKKRANMVTVRLPVKKGLHRRLKAAARKHGRSLVQEITARLHQ